MKKYPGFRDGTSKGNAGFQRISIGIARMRGWSDSFQLPLAGVYLAAVLR